jgi:signal transduction histidine kinase
MGRAPLERLSIRAALMVGFGLVFGLWLITGWAFNRHLNTVEEQSAVLTARYMRAQDLLSSIRAQINFNSIILRDALLDPSPASRQHVQRRLAESDAAIDAAVDAFEPVRPDAEFADRIAKLREEVADVRRVTAWIVEAGATTDPVALLDSAIAPRRAAAIAISEDLRDLNRRAFVQHQSATAALHRTIERQWWWTLGGAMGASIAIALLAVFYAGRLESRLQRQLQKDQQSASELQQLSQRLVAVQEEERRHIARELHDEVGQALSAIKVDLMLAHRDLERGGGAAAPLDAAQRTADDALQVVRDLSQLLRPAVLDDLGLAAAVDGLLRGLSRRHHVHVELVTEGLPHRLPADLEVTAFRIIQEALTNVARHAGATRCVVRIASHGDRVTLSVDDNGCGFDPRLQPGARRGLGLVGLRERVAERRGTIDIAAASGGGTRLLVSLPITSSIERETAGGDADQAVSSPAQVSHG